MAVVGVAFVRVLASVAINFGPAAALALAPGAVVAVFSSPILLLGLALGVYLAVQRIDS